MRMTRIFAACALLLSAAVTAQAQDAPMRQGFWIGGGLGYGSMGLSCDGCDGLGREGGFSGYAKLGGTLSPSFLLGVETNGWTKSEGGATVSMGNLSGAAYWYPAPTTGLFVKAGAGYSVLSADDGTGSGNDSGFGLLAGLGYDVPVGRNLSITPVANWFRGGFDGGSTNVLQIGVGVTAH
jgi:Outer membrane protein beta-barrel domain